MDTYYFISSSIVQIYPKQTLELSWAYILYKICVHSVQCINIYDEVFYNFLTDIV